MLRGGQAGELFANGSADGLAAAAARLLDDPARRAVLARAATRAVAQYDWKVVARDVLRVYEAVAPAAAGHAAAVLRPSSPASSSWSLWSRCSASTCPGARAGWTGCTPGWRRPAPRWTSPWCAAARSRWSWPSSGLLDPATSLLLASAAHDARSAREGRAQELPESDLTRALRAVFGQPGFRASLNGTEGADELLTELEGAAHQVFLARKFYNDAVAATRAARRRPLARAAAAGRRRRRCRSSSRSRIPWSEPASAGQGADMPHLTG